MMESDKRGPIMQTIFIILLFFCLPAIGLAESIEPPAGLGGSRETLIAVIPMDSPPTYFKDTRTGRPAGFAVDVMDEIARQSGFKVSYQLEKEWSAIINAVKTGKADVAPAMGITEERLKALAFTKPIDAFAVAVFVRSKGGITGLREGLVVGAIKGSAANEKIQKEHPNVIIKIFDSFSEGLLQLLAGQIDAFCCPAPTLSQLAREAGLEDKIQIVGEPVMELKRALAVRLDNTGLLGKLDQAIENFVGSPAYRQMYLKWYGAPQPYWSAVRTAQAMGGVLLLAVIILVYWRYRSIVRLNKQVSAAADALQATFNAVNDALFIHDLKTGAILDVNTKMCEMYGYGHDEALRLTVEDLSSGKPPYTQDAAIAWIKKAAQGEPQLFEWMARRKDGSLFWVEINMRQTFFGGEGRVIVAVRDITERKSVDQRLAESERHFRETLENSNLIAVQLDKEGRIVFANRFLVDLSGRPLADMVGQDWFALFIPAARREEIRKLHDINISGAGFVQQYENEIELPDGRARLIAWTNSQLCDAAGQLIGVTSLGVDITLRRQAEEELRTLNEELEQRVAERTAALGAKNAELERVNKIFVGRELKMIELKKQIAALENKHA